MSLREQIGFATKFGLAIALTFAPATARAVQDPGAGAEPPATQPVEPSPATPEPRPEPQPEPAPTTVPTEAMPQTPTDAPPATEPATAVEQPAAPAPAPAPPPPQPPLSPEEQAAQAALAERFVQMSKIVLQRKVIRPPMLRESIALLSAAVRANPREPRFYRLLFESRLEAGDTEGAKQTLKQYLDLLKATGQGDNVAAVKLIDLYASDMQAAEKKLEYLKALSGAAGLAEEIRAHASMRLAQVYFDRGQQAEAEAAIEEAVKLNPLSTAAQRVRYQNKREAATPAERIRMLLALLRANPAQPDVMTLIANELSDAAVVDAALQWYELGFSLSQRMGRGLGTAADFTDYTAALLAAGQARDASAHTVKLLDTDPGNADAAFIKLLAEKRLGEPESIAAAKSTAEAAVLRRLDAVHAKLAQQEPSPTTQPLDAVADQALADVQKLKDSGDAELYGAYVAGLARAAWNEIYFNENPSAAAKFVDALRSLLPEGDVLVARLEGWSFLVQGKHDEAKVKLSAVADRDPLSKFGMIRLNEKEAGADATIAELSTLVSENASGVTGSILIESLRDKGGRVTSGPTGAAARAELEKFPKAFLNILDPSATGAGTFYRIIAEPMRVAHRFGEPMIARVTIQNISDYDLSMGPEGTIKPDLWFGAKLQGMAAQNLPWVTYDRMGQQLVLKARTGIASQTVRLDEGPLAQLLITEPVLAISIMFNVLTNPVPTELGSPAPGPAGQRVQFTRVVDRGGSPLAQAQALIAPLAGGTGAERIRAAEMAATFVVVLSNPNAPPEVRPVAQAFYAALERAAAGNDPSPATRSWLDYQMATLSAPAQRMRILDSMLKRDHWVDRFLGMCLVPNFPPDKQKEIAGKVLETESDPLVRSLASAIIEVVDMLAADAAATQPSTLPTEGGQPSPTILPDSGGFNLNPSVPPTTPPTPPPSGGGGGGN